MTQIIDGKAIANELCRQLSNNISKLKQQGIKPCLTVILIGDDPASHIYVNNKVKRCLQIGIASQKIILESSVLESELIAKITELNNDATVHGILVQLPLPQHIDKLKVINAIATSKDVDGFSHYNTGALANNAQTIAPCTPAAVIKLLKSTGIELAGKNALVIGRSTIVGKPMAQLLLTANCTTTVAHSKTINLPQLCSKADIVIAAVGIPQLVKGSWLKPQAVVIDVGINAIEVAGKRKVVGDVDFESAKQVASHITPVPGGCGPMTIACLMENTLNLTLASS